MRVDQARKHILPLRVYLHVALRSRAHASDDRRDRVGQGKHLRDAVVLDHDVVGAGGRRPHAVDNHRVADDHARIALAMLHAGLCDRRAVCRADGADNEREVNEGSS